MTDSTTRQPNGHDCPPTPKDPADQPNPPGEYGCPDLPTTTPPPLPKPKCEEGPCKCPPKSGSDSNCLETLIAAQAEEIAKADKAKAFKTDLEALLGKAKTATQDYTRAKYEKLAKQWAEEDAAIAELIRKLVCALPCWKCVIECYICPLLNELHIAEKWVYGDGTHCTDVHDLQDLLYWRTRDKEAKERTFTRIKNVLAAWEKPAATIEKALADDQALIDSASKVIGTEPSKAVYDVFLRLVPMHLAIAPPKGSAWTTKIAKEYTEFCDCDKGKPDACCGPDVGELRFRDRLIGPQPYLIDPNKYYDIICCLVLKRYSPAKDALGEAEAAWLTIDNDIKRSKALIENGLKSFEKDAKAAVPTVIDCCDHEKKDQTETPQQTRR